MRRFTALLTATALATYLLIVLGATAAAFGGLPAQIGHYVAAGFVWLLVGGVAARAWLGNHHLRVRLGAALVLVAFSAQALVGMAGVLDVRAGLGQLHLLGGVVVFGLLLVTLVWHLDREVASGSSALSGIKRTTGVKERTEGVTDSSNRSVLERLVAYVALTKPRLMWLLCLLALAGMALATVTGARLDGVTVVATLAGGVFAIGAAGTFNHVYERDRDRRMARTADRPLATDRVDARGGALFGVGLFVASMAVFLALVNPLAAGLTALAVVYYAVGYTVVLKPSTAWNTVLGGGAGALPAVIGWAAVTGTVGLPAALLAAVVFCWTPAHFYNLAIVYRDEYANAGYPMLPVVKGIDPTRRRILYWLGATLVVAGGLGVVAGFGPIYALTSALVGFGFLWSVVEQYRHDTEKAAYRSFHASNAYLGAVLVSILLETMVV